MKKTAELQTIQDLIGRLPARRPIWRRCEADFYGASHVIAELTGRRKPPVSFATWRHGWVDPWWVRDPRLHLMDQRRNYRHLVFTQEHVNLLKEYGFNRVHAVGAPIIYTSGKRQKRYPGSLLVMPAHTLSYIDSSYHRQEYVDQIAEFRKYFTDIVFCLYVDDYRKGDWIPILNQYGFPYLEGADSYDANSLWRMSMLFQGFEYVTTNSMGSHVVYASYFGCKVSVYGRYHEYSERDFVRDPFYAGKKDLLACALESQRLCVVSRRYPQFFVPPPEAVVTEEWGRKHVGEKHRRKPEEVAQLLGWTPKEQFEGYIKEGCRLLLSPSSLKKLWRRRAA